jgi:hypothetical protein
LDVSDPATDNPSCALRVSIPNGERAFVTDEPNKFVKKARRCQLQLHAPA